MESLDGHAVKFSLKHILNLGQYDILSRCDSFGDIPGHGEIFFLDRKILWTLKSNLVLFLGMSFAALYKIYFRGTWSEMPMDEFRQLSVTFPDCFVSSVLGAVSVVTFTSYNFSTGGKQHGSLFRSFIERYMKISFSGVFFVFSFNHQIIQVKCFGIYKLESVRSMVNFFQNFLDRTADFYQNFLWFTYISSLSSQLSASSSVIFLCNATLVDGVSSYVVSLPVAVPPSPINIFSQIRDS